MTTKQSRDFWKSWQSRCAAILLLLGSSVGTLSYFISGSSQVSYVFVGFNSVGIPLAPATIQGIPCHLEVNTGHKHSLVLSKKMLAKLEKREAGVATSRDIKGNWIERPAFYIDNLQLGELTFQNVLAVEDDLLQDDDYGTIGRPLLEQQNLLMDFRNSLLLTCNAGDHLDAFGYSLAEMTPIPFEIGRICIILSVTTDLGIKKLELLTGGNISCLRLPEGQDETTLPITSSKFVLGGFDFGPQELRFIPITSELSEIDGFIGMDFLRHHVTYIDFKNRVIYIGERE